MRNAKIREFIWNLFLEYRTLGVNDVCQCHQVKLRFSKQYTTPEIRTYLRILANLGFLKYNPTTSKWELKKAASFTEVRLIWSGKLNQTA